MLVSSYIKFKNPSIENASFTFPKLDISLGICFERHQSWVTHQVLCKGYNPDTIFPNKSIKKILYIRMHLMQ